MRPYSEQEIQNARNRYHEMFTEPSADILYQEGVNDYLAGNRDTPSAAFFIKVQQVIDIAYLAIDKS